VPQALEHTLGPPAVWHIGSRDRDGQEEAEGIDEDMALPAFDLFMGIKAADPPFSVVLPDWLSMMPALGWRRLPSATRTSPRRRSCMTCHVPSLRHCQK
jgi:hypothetical protein